MRNINLSEYLSFHQLNNRWSIACKNHSITIVPYNENILRVVTKPNEYSYRDFSYARILKPDTLDNWVVEDSEFEIQIKSNNGSLVFNKKLGACAFISSTGQSLSSEDAQFKTSWLGNQVTNYRSQKPNEKFYGLGEKTGNMNRVGRAFVNWNSDQFGYGINQDPLYASIPFFIAINDEGCYGIFLDSPGKTIFNFGASNNRFISFGAESMVLDYYFIFGNSLLEIVQQYSLLTGTMNMPPKWALGYHHSRYSFYPQQEVLDIVNRFYNKNIPVDVLHLDIHYMDQYKSFTWDNLRFPSSNEMMDKLHLQGVNLVTIIDPGIKIDDQYIPYKDGVLNDVFIKYPDGEPYNAHVWPGLCSFPDFTNSKTRQWWAGLIEQWMAHGIAGIWNDMNEPASWGQATPDLIEFNFDGDVKSHIESRNVFGSLMACASYEGMLSHDASKRYFNLTRSAYAGTQRFAAIWTGDNTASDDHLLLGLRMIMSLGLSGMPFAGMDIGGFVGNPSQSLYAKWISVGAFLPLFRGHSMINSMSSEPWCFGEEVESIAKSYIQLRYNLMPYLYCCFYNASVYGSPIVKPLFIEYPNDENVYDVQYQNQFLCGPSLLVIPSYSDQQFVSCYLPAGNWYDLYNDQIFVGAQSIVVSCPTHRLPIFVRASSLLLLQSPVQNLSQALPLPTIEFHLYFGDIDFEFIWYDDDGVSNENKTEDKYNRSSILYNAVDKTLTISPLHNNFESVYSNIRLYLHGIKTSEILINDSLFSLNVQSNYQFIEPIPLNDPFSPPSKRLDEIANLSFCEFDWDSSKTYVVSF